MIAALLKAGVGRLGRRYDYDTSYMREIVDADAYAGIKLAIATGFLRHDFGVPKPAYFAAKTRSTLRADCGPCLRLVVMMAAEQGVRTAELSPVFDRGVATAEVALAIRYADAVLDNSPGLMEILVDVDRHFGAGGRMGLATAVVAGQFFPLLKRGLGHGDTCEPVLREMMERERSMEAAAEDA